MSKSAKSCTVTRRVIKNKRGKVVASFMGRSAGLKTHGGECKAKPASSAVRAHRREFAKKAKLCARVTRASSGKIGGKTAIQRMAACMGSKQNKFQSNFAKAA